MKARHKLTVAIVVFVGLLAMREVGVLDWSAYRSNSKTNSDVTTAWGDTDDGMRVRGFDDHLPLSAWKIVTLKDGSTLRYAEAVSYPWTRWLPLIKVGHTRVQQRFAVTSGNETIATGRRVADTMVRAFGLLSARKYGQLVMDENARQLRDSVANQLAQRPAPPATSPAVTTPGAAFHAH